MLEEFRNQHKAAAVSELENERSLLEVNDWLSFLVFFF